MADLSAVFKKAPKEAVRYLAEKRQQPSDGWETVSAQAHQHAFTVAQTAGFDVLGDIKSALGQARDQGLTHKQFQEQLKPLLQAKGWWGQAIDAETGEILKQYPGTSRPVRYGTPARLKLIYDQNMAGSNAAGRRERQLATAKLFPYWRYVAVMDGRTRPTHKALNGQVFPTDHPFWAINYPPQGFRCRCTVQALTQAQVDKAGIQVESAEGEFVERQVPVNAGRDQLTVRGWKTGDGREFWPDPGFDHAPGDRQLARSRLGSSMERLPDSALPAASRAVGKGAFSKWREQPEGTFPVATMPRKHAGVLGHKGSRTVHLSADTMQRQELAQADLTDADYGLIQEAVSTGRMVQESETDLVYLVERDGIAALVRVYRTGDSLRVDTLRRMSAADASRDPEFARARKAAK
jgi:SPP1 gp7 family putative phage head morphogenesis protein